ncbi:hypothetical protein OIU76_015473 [Salix suchowensis]|nr:hypothetical protein OIU76_015473 [Salix suchowensis]
MGANFGYHSVSNGENEGTLALMAFRDGATAGAGISTPVNRDREGGHVQNRYDVLEQRLHHVQGTIDALVSPCPDESSPESSAADMSTSRSLNLTRSMNCRENFTSDPSPGFENAEQIDSTPPNGFGENFTGRPAGPRRKIPPPDFGDDEDIPSIQTFVAGLKEMAQEEYEKQLVDGQVQETEAMTVADNYEKSSRDMGLDPMHESLKTSPNWTLEFERKQKAMLELWQTCNVSLVHRTYFFLLFQGDPTDSIYMEVEYRRLSFLKETFSQGNQGCGRGSGSHTSFKHQGAASRERDAKQADEQEVFRRREKQALQEVGYRAELKA